MVRALQKKYKPPAAIRLCYDALVPNHQRTRAMARLTITLSDERRRALREAAVKRGKTIGQLIEESLEFYGIKSARSAGALVAKARARASLPEADALRLAVAETRAVRRR